MYAAQRKIPVVGSDYICASAWTQGVVAEMLAELAWQQDDDVARWRDLAPALWLDGRLYLGEAAVEKLRSQQEEMEL